MTKFLAKKINMTMKDALVAFVILVIGATLSIIVVCGIVKKYERSYTQAVILASEGVDGTKNIRAMNWLRYSDPECWKASIDIDECDPTTTPMMARVGETKFYGLLYNDTDGDWSLNESTGPEDKLTNNMVLSNEKNIYSVNSDTSSEPFLELDDMNFYRELTITSQMVDLDQDTTSTSVIDTQEVLLITSTVKWLYLGKVRDYSISTVLTNFK